MDRSAISHPFQGAMEPEAIKACIRQNERVLLTLYRDGLSGEALRADPRLAQPSAAETLPLRLALPRAAA